MKHMMSAAGDQYYRWLKWWNRSKLQVLGTAAPHHHGFPNVLSRGRKSVSRGDWLGSLDGVKTCWMRWRAVCAGGMSSVVSGSVRRGWMPDGGGPVIPGMHDASMCRS
ncbi:hypothetical protein K431DRAFT_98868 [Polychaeton citri CBS 116435]|uniref:Uncharacterized protein n=1 Tax=Polychaeton citri CBS 116435 TaxID=1314669 RepID=A0A9P4QEZ1_9PEZI|nr:hypothetical protein K431DRAFT_98868 [Polychaeton citri CBS 116435]